MANNVIRPSRMVITGFSKWKKWHNRNELCDLNYPGIYALAISSEDLSDNLFKPLRKDIVYFGMTNSKNGLRGRLRQFDVTIKTHKRGLHGGAERFLFDHPNYDELTGNLYASINFVKCNVDSGKPEDLYKMGEVANFEYACFAEYVEAFNELPKYNNKKRIKKVKQ